jgi:hypothetical protein
MEPVFAHGDQLLVEPLVGMPPVRLGEVVVARLGSLLVAHRVVGLADGRATLRGDACPRFDPPVPITALLGRVIASRRGRRPFPWDRLVNRAVRRVLRLARGG